MHEVAHHLSFNCGLLNRNGDVPYWLGEGLACYCEATEHGVWQGIGESNSERLQVLAAVDAGQLKRIALRDLIETDDSRAEPQRPDDPGRLCPELGPVQVSDGRTAGAVPSYLRGSTTGAPPGPATRTLPRRSGPTWTGWICADGAFMQDQVKAWRPGR